MISVQVYARDGGVRDGARDDRSLERMPWEREYPQSGNPCTGAHNI